jgi:hypothetical protein
MNKRIQELVEQAKASVPAGLPVSEWIDTYNHVFAQLIVKECTEIAINNGCGDFVDIEHILFEHFGVKEC